MTTQSALDGLEVTLTAGRLAQRVRERFPDTGLARVCEKIHQACTDTQRQIDSLKKPVWRLRVLSLGTAAFAVSILLYMLMGGISWSTFALPDSFESFVELLEPTLGSLVFLVAFFVFIASLERRWKERNVLTALNDLRSLAHIIDMHQLTKDPERLLLLGPDTASSPERTFTPFQLGRYLDYCSEMLSILSKVSALWAQAFPEPNLVTAVDQIEMLTNGLSRKIWQKLMMLEAITTAAAEMSDSEQVTPPCP